MIATAEQLDLLCSCCIELQDRGLPLELLPVVYEDTEVVAVLTGAGPDVLAKASVELVGGELRIAKTVKSHLARHGKWEKRVADALHGVMRRMAADTASRIRGFQTLEVTRILPRDKWWREARNAVLPLLQAAAEESALETLRRAKRGPVRKQAIEAGDLSYSSVGDVLIKLPENAKAAMNAGMAETFGQSYWQEWEATTRGLVQTSVSGGVRAGLNLLDIASVMEDQWPFSYRRAMLVARTECNMSLNVAHYEVGQALIEDPRSIVSGRAWISIIDKDTRPAHRAANGQRVVKLPNGAWVVQDVGKQQIATGPMFLIGGERCRYPGDPTLSAGQRCNCVLPYVQVSGTFMGGLKGWYSGEVVEIATLKGHRATLTVNHPVLASTGLVAAGELAEGDHVVCESCDADWRPPRRHHEEEHAPAEAEQVFDSLCAGGAVWPIGPGALDLDGDEQFFIGQVDGPAADPSLVVELQTAGEQRLPERKFVPSDQPDKLLLGGPGGNELGAVATPSSSFPCGTQLPVSPSGPVASGPLEHLGFAASPHFQSESIQGEDNRCSCDAESLGHFKDADALTVQVPHSVVVCSSRQCRRFGAASDWDVELPEPVFQGVVTDAGLYGEFLHRLSGKVSLDELVEVREFHWSGPVYDFDTTVSYFSAGGIAIRNCRCTVIELFEGEIDEQDVADARTDQELAATARSPLSELLPADALENLPRTGSLGEIVRSAELRLDRLMQARVASMSRYKTMESQTLLETQGRFASQARQLKEAIKQTDDIELATGMEQRLAGVKGKIKEIKAEVDNRKEVYEVMRLAMSAAESQKAGKIALQEGEMARLLSNVGDVYIDAGWKPSKGKPPYAPELFITSDISGKPMRFYVTLPDGRRCHPDELKLARTRGNVVIIGDIAVPTIDWTTWLAN